MMDQTFMKTFFVFSENHDISYNYAGLWVFVFNYLTCGASTKGLTKRLLLSQSQTEVSQSQVRFHFLDGHCYGYRLVQNTESPLAVAQ